MYFKYLKERFGYDSLAKECGFCVYSIIGKECLLVDIFVDTDFRSKGFGSHLLEDLAIVAKEAGCEIITAREYPSAKNTSHSMLCALSNGFEIISSNNEFIIIGKRI